MYGNVKTIVERIVNRIFDLGVHDYYSSLWLLKDSAPLQRRAAMSVPGGYLGKLRRFLPTYRPFYDDHYTKSGTARQSEERSWPRMTQKEIRFLFRIICGYVFLSIKDR